MERRELLKMIAVLTGTAFIGGEFILSGCNSVDAARGNKWSEQNLAFLDEVGETILPTTSTPGAKAAQVSKTMKAVVSDCYPDNDVEIFLTSIDQINDASNKKFTKPFLELTAVQREELLKEIDKEAKAYQQTKKAEDPNHYFTMVKQLTLLGYFTSEIGCTQAQRYIPVPGRYDGCVPYTKGDKSMAFAR